MYREAIEKAKEHFAALLEEQFERIEKMKANEEWVDYTSLNRSVIRRLRRRWHWTLHLPADPKGVGVPSEAEDGERPKSSQDHRRLDHREPL